VCANCWFLLITSNLPNSCIFITSTYSWNPFNCASEWCIHCVYSSSPPFQPTIQSFNISIQAKDMSVTHPVQSAQHAHVARPISILLVSFLSSLFLSTYLYLSLFPLHVFRFFFSRLFCFFLSCPFLSVSFYPYFFPSPVFFISTFVLHFSMSFFSSRFSIPYLRVFHSGNTPIRQQQYFPLL
jgi:hypothetical protein